MLVCVGDDNRIDVIDTATLSAVRQLDTGADPETLALSPSGKTLGRVPVGIEPEGIAVNRSETIAVVVSESTSMAHFFDPKTQKVVHNVLVDVRPKVVVFPDLSDRHAPRRRCHADGQFHWRQLIPDLSPNEVGTEIRQLHPKTKFHSSPRRPRDRI